MSRPGRILAVLGVLLIVLLGVPAGAGAAGDPDERAADRVLVVGIPGLTWSDVDESGTPELWALAGDSSIGALSVRAARSTTCVLDGWATLGAGNRARVPGPDDGLPPVPLPTVQVPDGQAEPTAPSADGAEPVPEPPVDSSLSYCGLQERAASVALVDPAATVQRTAEDDGTVRFGAEPGALGKAVGCATVSGRAAALAVAVPGVDIERIDPLPADAAPLADALSGCRLTLVTLNQLSDAGQPSPEKTDDGTDPERRVAALSRIDRIVGQLRAAVATLPGKSLLLLAGISEVNDGRPQLHVGMVSGPGFSDSAWLRSASTGRAPFAQLIDVAPTALRALEIDQPASMNGQVLDSTGDRPPLVRAVEELNRANAGATVHNRNTGFFFWTLVLMSAALLALGVLVLGGVPGVPTRRPASTTPRTALRTLAIAAAAVPVATYLAGIVPWERADPPAPAMVAALVGADAVVAAGALLGPWRRSRLGPAIAVLAITFLTLIGDVLTGSGLELNGLLGYDAIVAGRFTGYGNLTFALLAVAGLTLTAAAATAVGRRVGADRARAATAGTVLGIGALTVGVIGAPGLGRDFGGLLSSLPAFLLLAMLLARVRVTVVRLVAILAAGVVVVGTVAVLDWLRPASERTHLGRFVEQVLTGEAWTVIGRKGQANLDILMRSPLAWMLPVAVVAAVWLIRPGGLLRSPGTDATASGPGGLPAGDAFALRSSLLAVGLALALGAAVNDSGVAVPAVAATLLVPLLVWLAAEAGRGGTGSRQTEGGAPHSGPVDDRDRVTVVSRGSTVSNA
jgi:hypothetical protein